MASQEKFNHIFLTILIVIILALAYWFGIPAHYHPEVSDYEVRTSDL